MEIFLEIFFVSTVRFQFQVWAGQKRLCPPKRMGGLIKFQQKLCEGESIQVRLLLSSIKMTCCLSFRDLSIFLDICLLFDGCSIITSPCPVDTVVSTVFRECRCSVPSVSGKPFTFSFSFNTNPDGYKNCVAVWLGVIYDYQATNRKQGRLHVKAPLPPPHFYWSPGIYDSQPAGIHKKATTNRWKLLLFS